MFVNSDELFSEMSFSKVVDFLCDYSKHGISPITYEISEPLSSLQSDDSFIESDSTEDEHSCLSDETVQSDLTDTASSSTNFQIVVKVVNGVSFSTKSVHKEK
jgi:hypothetical protein